MGNPLEDDDDLELDQDGDPVEAFRLRDRWAGFEPAPIPVAPDGGIDQAVFAGMDPTPIPEVTPETFICLRGPCRHLFELVCWGDYEAPRNDDGTPHVTKESFRSCTVQPGVRTSLDDNVVYECSLWNPITTSEISRRSSDRKKHDPSLYTKLKNAVPSTRSIPWQSRKKKSRSKT